MAQPITFDAPAKAAPTNLERLQNAPAEHAEAVLSGYEFLQLLHDRGVLNLLRGLVGGGDALVGTIAAAVDTPESIRAKCLDPSGGDGSGTIAWSYQRAHFNPHLSSQRLRCVAGVHFRYGLADGRGIGTIRNRDVAARRRPERD